MKLPNWFKIIWWIVLLAFTGTILYKRYDAITTGQAVVVDVFVLLIFVALTLVPIFSEIEFFGIKLKKEIEDLKYDINIKLGEIKNEIRNSQTQTVHQTFQTFGPPPPDNKLRELQGDFERILSARLKEHAVTQEIKITGEIDVPQNSLLMFQVRYNIEKMLRLIWEQRFGGSEINGRLRHQPVISIIQDLTKFEIIDNNFYAILREVLSICNYAIHGEDATENQVDFVNRNAKQILDYLSQVK